MRFSFGLIKNKKPRLRRNEVVQLLKNPQPLSPQRQKSLIVYNSDKNDDAYNNDREQILHFYIPYKKTNRYSSFYTAPKI
jgi:hypothetical protein